MSHKGQVSPRHAENLKREKRRDYGKVKKIIEQVQGKQQPQMVQLCYCPFCGLNLPNAHVAVVKR